MKNDPVYTVTTIHFTGDTDFKGVCDTRCVGFFHELGIAQRCVESNDLDIYECGYYPYCVIEKVEPGFYFVGREEWWYVWDKERKAYLPTKQPERFRNICNFGIG